MPLAKENISRQNAVTRNKEKVPFGVVNRDNKCIKVNEHKRMAENNTEDGPNRKRCVLGDLTNNTDDKLQNSNKENTTDKLLKNTESLVNLQSTLPQKELRKSKRLSDKKNNPSTNVVESCASDKDCSSDDEADETKFETPAAICEPTRKNQNEVPDGVLDFDKEMEHDQFSASIYAQDIFRHFKAREIKFKLEKYLDHQREITKNMRAILVDWMAEVQESFELNHETLYLAVKLVDMYLSRVKSVPKANLQLIASTTLLIAAKFDERCPPAIEDFVYICDEAYTANNLIRTEINVLKSIDFDLGIPISYTFLRRYARCSKHSMELLTLARYILELTLLDYNLVDVLDSRLAAAALSLALQMSKQEPWTKTLEYYSGYRLDELADLIPQLNGLVKKAGKDGLKTIFTKYSHKIFYEVAKKPALDGPTS